GYALAAPAGDGFLPVSRADALVALPAFTGTGCAEAVQLARLAARSTVLSLGECRFMVCARPWDRCPGLAGPNPVCGSAPEPGRGRAHGPPASYPPRARPVVLAQSGTCRSFCTARGAELAPILDIPCCSQAESCEPGIHPASVARRLLVR